MRILQSYWFKPYGELSSSRYRGGFPSPRHFWSALALSALLARENLGPVEFHTDSFGAENAERLALPYDRVVPTFDSLPPAPSYLWAFSKLMLCAAQEQPYLHLDSDFFVFIPPSAEFLCSEILIQSVESGAGHEQFYLPAATELAEYIPIPNSLRSYLAGHRPFRALNCGMIGGTAHSVIKQSFESVTSLMADPTLTEAWTTIAKRNREHREAFNCVLEQQTLAYAVEDAGITPTPLVELGPNQQIPTDDHRFLHLIGNNKFEARFLNRVAQELLSRAPEIAQRIHKAYP